MNTLVLPRAMFALRSFTTDRVVAVCCALLIGLAVVDTPQALASIRFTFESLLSIGPFLLLAVAVAAYAKASGADALISRAFAGHRSRAVVMAALVGALSPFCSCGVVPLIAAMLRSGVPLAPVMAFWIASPIMDPEMFIVTAAGIGMSFAIAKTIATVAMGLLAGFAVMVIERQRGAFDVLLPQHVEASCCGAKPSGLNTASQVQWQFWSHKERRRAFRSEASSNGLFLLRWLTLAFVLESLMIAYIPAQTIAGVVGGGQWFAIPLASVVGIPAYLNGYAAVPMVSGLMELGMSPGAAMSFVTAGAVSSIPAAIAVWALVRRRVFMLYVCLGLTGSALSGLAYQFSGFAV